ncbi:MAG: succinate dehydrogenase, hydrophobic membrane anchor protein [Paracoccaceae bacterium]
MSYSKSLVNHHFEMKITSIALFFLIPLFIFTFGSVIGEDHDSVVGYLSMPFPALIVALTLIIGLRHFQLGAQTLIEDYIRGHWYKVALFFVKALSYFLMAVGLYAIGKIAL